MNRTVTDLISYIKYHFLEASIFNGSSFPYKIWAAKRMLFVLFQGRKKSETYLYPKDVTIKNKEGIFFVPKQTDLILNISSKTEGNLLPYFTIDKGTIFVDIGANAGKWSIHVAKAFKGNKVIAFEPIPSTFSILKKNIELNNLGQQVRLLNIGLSNQNSIIDFTCNDYLTGVNGVFSKEITMLPKGFTLIKVEVKKLDDVILANKIDISLINLIKIDVEGHELSVLQGAVNTLKNLSPKTRLIIEIDISSIRKSDTLELLSDFGFYKLNQLDPINILFEKRVQND